MGGNTLVEVAISLLILVISALCLTPLLGTTRGLGSRGTIELEALGLIQGRVDALLADLSLGEAQSPLFNAAPLDFTTRYVTASGNAAAPWTLSTAAAYDALSVPGLNGYRMQTTIQYFHDAADPLATRQDALNIKVKIVPTNTGASNVYPTTWLETYWYRNP